MSRIHPNGKHRSATQAFVYDERMSSTLIEQVNAWLDEISPGARFCVERVELGDDENFVVKPDTY